MLRKIAGSLHRIPLEPQGHLAPANAIGRARRRIYK
jgi:hypothetical protein